MRAPGGPVARELAFPYHPHVTVAHGISEESMDRAQEELAGFEASWTATGFALYEQGSDLVWRLQRKFAFGSSDEASPRRCPAAAPRRCAQPVPACEDGAGSFAPAALTPRAGRLYGGRHVRDERPRSG